MSIVGINAQAQLGVLSCFVSTSQWPPRDKIFMSRGQMMAKEREWHADWFIKCVSAAEKRSRKPLLIVSQNTITCSLAHQKKLRNAMEL
jgi:hypothetical protein